MTMKYSREAHAKINLSLDVIGRREDGYHEVRMIMHQVQLADTVSLVVSDKIGIRLTSDSAQIPLDEKNIAYRAARLMIETFGLNVGFDIHIEKRIPVAGGMAGGSTDAAAVLRLINDACGLNLSIEELMSLGLKLGADVPYCIYERPALAEGVGEKLSSVCGLPPCKILIVNPGVEVSTKDVYEAMDNRETVEHVETEKLIECLTTGNLEQVVKYMKNTMQPVSAKMHSCILDVVKKLESLRALHAMMSGSGATCFGIFDVKADLNDIKNEFPGYIIEITEPYYG